MVIGAFKLPLVTSQCNGLVGLSCIRGSSGSLNCNADYPVLVFRLEIMIVLGLVLTESGCWFFFFFWFREQELVCVHTWVLGKVYLYKRASWAWKRIFIDSFVCQIKEILMQGEACQILRTCCVFDLCWCLLLDLLEFEVLWYLNLGLCIWIFDYMIFRVFNLKKKKKKDLLFVPIKNHITGSDKKIRPRTSYRTLKRNHALQSVFTYEARK